LALPSPLVPTHPLKKVKGATPDSTFGDGSHDVAIAFCYDDANLVTVNECGERYQSTCTGSNGQGVCCSAAGKCGDDEAHCGEGMQEEYSHSKNLCQEGQSSDGFDQQAAAAAGLQQAQDEQDAVAVIDPEKNAADLKALMDAACDFDAQGCDKITGVCSACYIHFEACRNGPHFEKDGTTPKQATLDECMDQVAKNVAECSGCDTDDSKEGYKVRTGEHNPPGVEPNKYSSWKASRFSVPPNQPN